MTRMALDREMNTLHTEIANLAAKVETIMRDTIVTLKHQDKEMAKFIFENDNTINAAQNRIEQQCVNVIALQQPLASDLRDVMATLKMVTDIERVADQCADICEIVATYPELNRMQTPPDILTMFDKAKEMFSEAVDAFIRKDRDQAADVRAKDDIVDAFFSKVIMEMSNLLAEDKTLISQATDYMFIAKYLERMGDHATNIAEWTIYAVSGEHKNMSNKLLGAQPKLGKVSTPE